MTQIFDEDLPPLLPKRPPSASEVKRILRAVATIILAAFAVEDAVKPSKKASVKKKRRAKTRPQAKRYISRKDLKRAVKAVRAKRSPKKKYAIKAKRTTRSSKKKAKRK